MPDLSEHLRACLRPGMAGRQGHAAFAAALKADQALLQAAHERLAQLEGVIARRSFDACFITARDASVLRQAIGETG
jgi:hypothetical protein